MRRHETCLDDKLTVVSPLVMNLRCYKFDLGRGGQEETGGARPPGNCAPFQAEYEVGEELGAGGFGKVHGGVRRADGKPVAIKQVAVGKVVAWEKLQDRRVPLELLLLLRVQAVPGVVRILDFYERRDSFIFIMERPANGMDMFDFISKKKKLEEDLARKLFWQTLNILVACAARGVYHKDIKDENLVVDLDKDKLVLVDFGSGGVELEDREEHRYEGTRLYAPPEWIQHRRFRAESLTVWQLGILLYVMLVGDIPFHEDLDILAGLEALRPRIEVSPDCGALLRGLLAPREGDRLRLTEVAGQPWLLAISSHADSDYITE
jgi:serine/threonine protein kinase